MDYAYLVVKGTQSVVLGRNVLLRTQHALTSRKLPYRYKLPTASLLWCICY